MGLFGGFKMEQWNKIENFPGYEISSLGRIKSLPGKPQRTGVTKKTRILRGWLMNNGYRAVVLFAKNRKTQFYIHRLVASAFILNPEKKPFVNHKNGIRDDNRLENLEWCTQSENMIHSYKILGQTKSMLGKTGKLNPFSISIIQIKNGINIAEFPGISEAARITKISSGTICECCKGKRKTAGGYQWKYKQIKGKINDRQNIIQNTHRQSSI